MKKYLLTLLAIASIASPASAAFVSFGTGGARGHQFLLSDTTTRVPIVGGTVQVGYLTSAGDSSTFQLFGSSSISNPLSAATIGGFVTNATLDNPAANGANSVIAGKQLAIWVTAANGNQGIFTSTNWVVPGTLGTATDQSFNVVLGVNAGALAAPITTVPIPGFTPASVVNPVSITVTTGTNATGTSYILGAIPEPSVTALLGLLGLAALRRKR